LWEWLLLYDKELGRDANKGAWDTPVMISNQMINLCVYELFDTYALKGKKWMKGGHPMESASHGLRIEKGWGSMCLDQITHE
jgi:hypothetical protein